MASDKHVSSRGALVAALACIATMAAPPARAQQTVVVTGRSVETASIGGFGPVPLARAPLQAASFGSAQLADLGVASLAQLTRLDASVGDAYNAEGYWPGLAVRGYALDTRFNLRRDGLPIIGETALTLDNKERIELLKGTSGIHAGTSAPGGLVNLVVKRPNGPKRELRLEWRDRASLLAGIDLGERFGSEGQIGVRLNATAERLDPAVRHTRGQRALLAAAVDWQFGPDTLLQAEVETSHQRQPSVSGYSLLGQRVPAPREIDPRRNLNDQPWRQDVVFDADTASLRWLQRLSEHWRFTVHAMQQRLENDDRTAFPYGVYDAATYGCDTACDRFASDGSFTYWEYISDDERRDSRALQAALSGSIELGGMKHDIEAGVLRSRYRGRFHDQIFDIAGTGRIDGSLITPRSAGFTDANTDRDERSTEWFARDAVQLDASTRLWLGLRHVQLVREARRTSPDGDGSLRETRLERGTTTPWLAASAQLGARTMLYASWGRGLETDVAPNRVRYVNAGASFLLRSRQAEIGVKHGGEQLEAALTLFDIQRDQTSDLGACGDARTCERIVDGVAQHRGVEAFALRHIGPWTLQAGLLLLDAERRGASDAALNGQRPVNVPRSSLRAGVEWRVPAVAGLAASALLVAEGDRRVLPYDTSLRIPGWARLDIAARWQTTIAGRSWTWRAGIDNLFDRRAWKESPYQFGHAYLYPLAPRSARLGLQLAL